MAARDQVKWHWIDFVVELFGGLIPGLVCVAAMVAIGAAPLDAIGRLVADRHGSSLLDTPATGWISNGVIDELSIPVFVLLFCISYIVGQVFFRQDPKEPDRRSLERMKAQYVKDHPDLAPTEYDRHFRDEFGCASKKECQFPYKHLGKYFLKRGLNHYLWFVTWDPEAEAEAAKFARFGNSAEPKRANRRTKVLINSLKIRLQMHAPEHYNSVARNEAHVRLASSTWYMCRMLIASALAVIGIYGLMLLSLGLLGLLTPQFPADYLRLARPIIPALIVGVLSYLTRRSTEQFVHYQRLREIIYVVETTGVAFRRQPGLLRDIFPYYVPHAIGDETAPIGEKRHIAADSADTAAAPRRSLESQQPEQTVVAESAGMANPSAPPGQPQPESQSEAAKRAETAMDNLPQLGMPIKPDQAMEEDSAGLAQPKKRKNRSGEYHRKVTPKRHSANPPRKRKKKRSGE